MKRILFLVLLFVVATTLKAQYPVTQFLGSDSAMVKSRGGLQGRFAPIPFTDTAAANLSRIRQYPGALVYTSGVDKYWYRNATATGWVEFTSSGGSTVNIYNSNGTLTGARILSGGNNSLTFDELVGFDVTSTSGAIQFNFFKSDGKSSYFVLGDTIKINPNLGNLLIDTLNTTQDTSTYKPIVVDPVTGRVMQSSYWYGGSGGSGADSSVFATLYRVDSAKAYLRASINSKIDSLRRVGLNVQTYKNGEWVTQYPDSVGGGGDTSVFIIDTLYNRLAYVINADSLRLKSLRMQLNGSDVTPTVTDSTLSFNIIASTAGLADSMAVVRSRYDRAYDTLISVNDSTVVWQRFDGTSDTLQFHPGSRDRFGFTGEDVSATADRLFNSTHSFRMFLDSFIVHGSVLRLDTIDFHIKGDSLQDLFYVNTNTNKIGIGTKNPYNLIGNTTTQITDGSNGVSGDGVGFRLSVGGYMAAFENESTGTGRGILVKSGGDFGILNVQNESNMSLLRADKDSVVTEVSIADADSTRQIATTKWVKKITASLSGGSSPYPTSFEKNSTRDSVILTLSNGTRFAAKDSTGGASGLTVGTTTVSSSNSRGILYDSSGTLKDRADVRVETNGNVNIGYYSDQGYKLGVNGTIVSTTMVTTGTGTFISGLFTSGGFSTSHSNSDNAGLYVRGGTTASTTTQSEILIGGASTVGNRASFRGSANYTMLANNSYGGVILGKELQTEASSGTHALYAKLAIRQDSVVNGTATTTHATSLYIQGPPTTNGSFGTSTSAYIQTGDVLLGSGILTATGGLKTGDPGSGAGTWKLGTAVTTSGLNLNTTTYVEVSIGGTVYRLAVVDPPQP